MPPISSWPDMNSRAAGPRSHKRRIRPYAAVSNRDEVIEAADQGKQCRIGYRLIPVIEDDGERRLAPYGADHGTEDDGHPQERGKASAEADTAKRCKDDQDDHSQAEANDHLGRSQLLRVVRELRQIAKLRRSTDRGSAEIIAADRFVERTGVARHDGDTGPARGR